VGDRDAEQLREDVELIDGVYGELNAADYLDGKIAPVFLDRQLIILVSKKCWTHLLE